MISFQKWKCKFFIYVHIFRKWSTYFFFSGTSDFSKICTFVSVLGVYRISGLFSGNSPKSVFFDRKYIYWCDRTDSLKLSTMCKVCILIGLHSSASILRSSDFDIFGGEGAIIFQKNLVFLNFFRGTFRTPHPCWNEYLGWKRHNNAQLRNLELGEGSVLEKKQTSLPIGKNTSLI